MNNEQRKELVQACENGDGVKVITVCLAICASMARDGEQDQAAKARALIDRHKMRESLEMQYRDLRLKIATRLCAYRQIDAVQAFVEAEYLISMNQKRPIPDGATESLLRPLR